MASLSKAGLPSLASEYKTLRFRVIEHELQQFALMMESMGMPVLASGGLGPTSCD